MDLNVVEWKKNSINACGEVEAAWKEIDRTNKTEDENKNVEKKEKKGNGKCNLTLQ